MCDLIFLSFPLSPQHSDLQVWENRRAVGLSSVLLWSIVATWFLSVDNSQSFVLGLLPSLLELRQFQALSEAALSQDTLVNMYIGLDL